MSSRSRPAGPAARRVSPDVRVRQRKLFRFLDLPRTQGRRLVAGDRELLDYRLCAESYDGRMV